MNGLNQSIGEMLIGGVGGAGKGLLNKVFADTNISLIDKITNPRLKALAQLGMRSLGEGVEEVVQGIADTGFRKLTYEPDAKLDPAGLAYEGLLGFGMGLTFGAPQFARDLQTPRIAAQAQTNDYYNQRIENIRAQENDLHGRLRTVDEDAIYERLTSAKNNTEKSGILAGASEDIIASAVRIADKGVDILFERIAKPSDGKTIDGYEYEGKLYVNPESQNTLSFITGHELTHTIEKAKSYDKFSKYVLDRIGNVEAERARIRRIRESAGTAITDAEIDREIVADFAGRNLMTSESDIIEMVRTDRTLGERIKTWLDDMVKRFTGTDEEKFYIRARDLYKKALAESKRADVAAEAAAYSVSAVDDTAYMNAVERGDTEAAQKMVDEAAKATPYTTTAFHGTPKGGFTEFRGGDGQKDGLIFFTSNEEYADNYARNNKPSDTAQTYKVRLNLGKTKTIDFKGQSWDSYKTIGQGTRNVGSEAETRQSLEKKLRDGLSEKYGGRYIPPEQVKARAGIGEYYDAEFTEAGRQIFTADDIKYGVLVNDKADSSAALKLTASSVVNGRQTAEYLRGLIGNRDTAKQIYQEYAIGLKDIDKQVDNRRAELKARDTDFDGTESYYGNVYKSTNELAQEAKSAGYDSATFLNVLTQSHTDTEYVVFSPRQIKSADPVTYDDNGNVI
ncbi:MAG: hypothetical protein PHO93_04930, partial [Candidatus Saccharimonadaceae bacterium]|nr:hypothetical protein [Candidatus Saccharimonadaceae bacterium]